MNKTGIAQSALPISAVMLTMVAVLAAMGRHGWCSCGSPVPWSWDIWSSHNSQHLLDPYFFSHVLHGVLLLWAMRSLPWAFSARTKLVAAVAIEAAWEILENSPIIIERYRETTISLDYFGDSIANSIFDVLACLLGYLIASRLRWWGSLAIFAVVELALLWTIRDSLVLNVIMLVYPLDLIKAWQTG